MLTSSLEEKLAHTSVFLLTGVSPNRPLPLSISGSKQSLKQIWRKNKEKKMLKYREASLYFNLLISFYLYIKHFVPGPH